MQIDWAQVTTMLIGAFLALLGSIGASSIQVTVANRRRKHQVKRRLRTQLSGLVASLRRIQNSGAGETQLFRVMVGDLKQWHAQLLHDREHFASFKDPEFERSVIDWHFDIGRLITVSDGIDAAAEERRESGFDFTDEIVGWREGLVERLAKVAEQGDHLLGRLNAQ